MNLLDWAVVGPAVIVAVGAVVAFVVDRLYRRRTWLGSGIPSGAALVGATAELLRTGGPDELTHALSLVLLVAAAFVVVASNVMNFESSMPPGAYHSLIMAGTAGALVVVVARDLVTLVVAMAMLALASAALVGLRQGDEAASLAGRRFLRVSLASTAVTVVGAVLLLAITGAVEHDGIRDGLRDTGAPTALVVVAVALTLTGLLVALGAVPLHLWVPDIYRGSSVMAAAFLSTVSRVAALGAMIVLLVVALPGVDHTWMPLVAVVAVVTMTVGNLGALRQTNAIGMLAWSSIAQGGFVLAPIAVLATGADLAAPLRYVAVHVVANLVAFSALAIVLRLRESTDLLALKGLARTDPPTGVPLAVAAVTLAGLPPVVVAMVTKYDVVEPVIEQQLWLGIIMIANVALGLVYLLRLVAVLLGRADDQNPYVSPSPPVSVRVAKSAIILGALLLVVLSAWPDLLLSHFP